ncbi:biotin synthase [Gloeomargarita lithophora Alchichica-D10]|uniref:Biotin synthase n=1 Tax=Gloeomargarita lithophora Alchichica-D10 TaxID=1188229 RepID=A0A1J0AHA3_9CYAN|nr:biotin synthase BioB [Gloeomargarita lithophora]APB35275.1 biotin synthase [Gloeomargarita lithophora Alchichica-D10]
MVTQVGGCRWDWQIAQVQAIYEQPLLDLIHQAATVHRQYHPPAEIQVCKLVSIKTGGCVEDCGYCAQSAHHDTGIAPQPLMAVDEVLAVAQRAQAQGVSRVCLGAAWREVRPGKQFDQVLDMIRQITALGLEVCCTLGMLTSEQAERLDEAGLYAYNHNLDTSRSYYPQVIRTRSYDDRLHTLAQVRQTPMTVCCGGILGLGETHGDRMELLTTLANLQPHPESVPINILSQVAGTPLAGQNPVPIWDVLRVVATARILMPKSDLRLAAGRAKLSPTEQALCFLAGVNSIFSSDDGQMLTRTTPCPDYHQDQELLNQLGLMPRPARSRV